MPEFFRYISRQLKCLSIRDFVSSIPEWEKAIKNYRELIDKQRLDFELVDELYESIIRSCGLDDIDKGSSVNYYLFRSLNACLALEAVLARQDESYMAEPKEHVLPLVECSLYLGLEYSSFLYQYLLVKEADVCRLNKVDPLFVKYAGLLLACHRDLLKEDLLKGVASEIIEYENEMRKTNALTDNGFLLDFGLDAKQQQRWVAVTESCLAEKRHIEPIELIFASIV